MTPVAFVTHQTMPEMVDDDRLVADALGSLGVPVVSAVWDDPAVDWPRFACVVIRSTWDYHHKPEQYAEWLRARMGDGTRLWNPPEAVLGNMNKRYLADLASRGVEVVPTEYLQVASGQQLRRVLETRGWDEVVIKPAVSASADGTWRSSLAAAGADQAQFEEQCRSNDVLVQPYLAEIESPGEWSLVFFGGQYSHAALKRPARGDFRVQEHCGGDAVPGNPPSGLVRQAGDVLSMVGSSLLYARVDGVDREGRLLLMELEINEPYLFMGLSPNAASRFAEAIKAVM